MGKRSREKKMVESAGRRRQMIQLDGVNRRSALTSDDKSGNQQSLRATKVSGIGLLGAYQEDSDDSGSQSPFPGPAIQQMNQPDERQPEAKMEDELAGFLAEINAIGDQPTAATVHEERAVHKTEVYDPENFDPNTQGHLLPEPWQAVYDESSGYHYFWNCETNEVQWIPPPAPVKQEPSLPLTPTPTNLVETEFNSTVTEENNTVTTDVAYKEPELAVTEISEEEKRKKELSSKLAGLSKKERIKLLLQKNNISTEQVSDDVTVHDNSLDQNESFNSKEEAKENQESEKMYEDVTPFQVKVDVTSSKKKLEKKPLSSGLVAGYDSDLSDSQDESEAVSSVAMDVTKHEIPRTNQCDEDTENIEVNRSDTVSMDTKIQGFVAEVLQSEDAGKLTVQADLVEKAIKDDESLNANACKKGDIAGSNEGLSIEDSKKDGKEEAIEEYIVKDSVEESVAMDKHVDGIPIHRPLSAVDKEATDAADSESVEVKEESHSNTNSNQNNYTERKGKKGTAELSEDAKSTANEKNFSVDIFADESGNEDERRHKTEVENTSTSDNRSDREGSSSQMVGKEEEEPTETSKGEESKAKESKLVDEEASDNDNKTDKYEKDRRSKHKVKSKDKIKEHKSKDKKKHRDHKDKKERTGTRRHRDHKDRGEKRKHKEKGDKKEKGSRRTQEDVKRSSSSDTFETKEAPELSIDELLEKEEQKKKEIEEEVEREERRRNEFEKLKKEELLKEKERNEEDQKKEVHKQKEDEVKKEDAENEMHDFAEMLLEGALEPEADEPRVGEPTPVVEANQNEAGDDMEISDNETEDEFEDGRPPLPPMPPPDEKIPYPREEFHDSREEPEYPEYDDEDARLRIADLSHTIFDKLAFLEVTRKGLTNFQVMLIEIETRMNDWREGALKSDYLLYRLEEVDAQICKYEETAAPNGWSCHWSSEHGMYYYYNEKTGESSWSYPITSSTVIQTGPVYGSGAKSSASVETKSAVGPLGNYGYGRTDMMMWRSDLVENRAVPLAKASTTLPKQEDVVSKDPYRDPYREFTTSKESPRPSSPDEKIFSPALPSSDVALNEHIPPPPGEEDESSIPNPWGDGCRSGSSSPVHLGMVAALPAKKSLLQPHIAGTDPGIATPNSDASYTTVKEAAKSSSVSAPLAYTSQALQVLPTSGLTQPATSTSVTKAEKKKKTKRKTLTSSGIPSKKLKNVSSLVQKWQQVKQKSEQEMQQESSEDDDPEVVAKKRIEDWRRSQLQSGKAAYNPNFQEIKGDWRERLKKK